MVFVIWYCTTPELAATWEYNPISTVNWKALWFLWCTIFALHISVHHILHIMNIFLVLQVYAVHVLCLCFTWIVPVKKNVLTFLDYTFLILTSETALYSICVTRQGYVASSTVFLENCHEGHCMLIRMCLCLEVIITLNGRLSWRM